MDESTCMPPVHHHHMHGERRRRWRRPEILDKVFGDCRTLQRASIGIPGFWMEAILFFRTR